MWVLEFLISNMFLKKQTFVIQTTDRQSNGAKLSLDAKHLKRD